MGVCLSAYNFLKQKMISDREAKSKKHVPKIHNNSHEFAYIFIKSIFKKCIHILVCLSVDDRWCLLSA